MADEKQDETLAQEKSDSKLTDAKTALDSENLSEEELNAVAGGRIERCNHLGLDELSSAVKLNKGTGRMTMEIMC